MKGQRVAPDRFGLWSALEPGQYIRVSQQYPPLAGEWIVCLPHGPICRLTDHTVIEAADGSISVDQTISFGNWTGALINGVWYETKTE